MARMQSPPRSCADPAPPRRPGSEPIPGYRLLQPLGKGGFGEVWKCEAPGGLLKAIKFVHGGLHALDDAPAEEELRAIERVKSIRHPFILSLERVERVGHELVIVLELADRSLADLWADQRAEDRPGITRESLLNYLREAAEALDVMNAHYDLQHLDIKPQNLFLVCNHVKVGDFGLVHSLAGGKGHALKLGAITPVYASPEVFQGSLSRHSDQYSLAVVYQELLTGRLPFDGKNSRQLLLQHSQGEPDLSPLPEADRAAVGRALAKDPHRRFPSCSAFVHALSAGQTEVVTATVPARPSAALPAARPSGDTRRTGRRKTVSTHTTSARPPALGCEAAARCKLLDLVNRSPLGEVWNAQAADGTPRLVKVLFGLQAQAGEPVDRLAGLHHPALPPCDVLEHTPGRVVLCTPPAERSLRDCLLECQAEGLPGIPRAQLLTHLGQAADALDALYDAHGMAHLDLSPRNLLLDGDRLLLADFGLVQLLWLPAGQGAAAVKPRYAAPELLAGQVHRACDQYSLALIYHELLIGSLPAPGGAGAPRLDRLPEADRAIVARALNPAPQQRWETTTAFVRALQAAGGAETNAPDRDGSAADVLQTYFGTTLAQDVVRQRLEGFRERWKGKVVSSGVRDLVFHMEAPRSYWQRCNGRQPALEVRIRLASPEPPATHSRTEVRVDIRAHQCGREQSAELLKVTAPLLVESVRTHLEVRATGRREERLIWQHPLQVCPVLADGSVGPAVECHGKDISLNGIGFYLPGVLIGPQVVLYLPQTPQTPRAILPARVVRASGCGDGWHEVGAILLPPVDEAVIDCPSPQPDDC